MTPHTIHTSTSPGAVAAPAVKRFQFSAAEVLTAAARVLLPFLVMAGILLLAR